VSETTGVRYVVQYFMNVGLLTVKNRTFILPNLRKFCVLHHCRASHT